MLARLAPERRKAVLTQMLGVSSNEAAGDSYVSMNSMYPITRDMTS